MTKPLFRFLWILAAWSLLLSACGPQAAAPEPAATAAAQPGAPTAAAAAAPTLAPASTPTQPGRQRSNSALGLTIPAPAGSAAEAAERLAKQLSAAASADLAAPILAEILTWAGVAIYDPSLQRINRPVEPLSQLHLFDFQVYGLALDFRNQGGMTLDELAQALSEAAGFTSVDAPAAALTPTKAPSPTAAGKNGKTTPSAPPDPNRLNADMLQALFSTWTTSALSADPKSWEAFTPLFLRAVNLAKSPALDLQYSGYAPGVVRLSTLELALFASDHVRDGSPAPDRLGMLDTGGGKLALLAPDNPCAAWNQSQQSLFGKWGAGGSKWATGKMLGGGWAAAGNLAGGFAGTMMKSIGTGIGWLLTGITTLAGMTAWEFSIRAEPNPAHYRHNEPNDIYAYFIATVKVNEKWPKWFADCLASVGTQMPSNDDLGANIIRWVPIHNLPPHAVIAPEDQNGRMEQHFSSAGEAKLKLKMDQEKNGDWETAPQKKDHLTVRGELYRNNSLPGASVLIMAASGNIPAAVTPILTKWADKWFPKKAYGVMNVTYHKIVPMSFTLQGGSGGMWWVASGYNCQGIYGKWTISITGASSDQGMNVILDGKLAGDLPKNSDGAFNGKLDILAVVSAAPVVGSINLAMNGKLRLSGSQDAPVLVIQTDQTNGKASGAGPTVSMSMPLSGPGGAPLGVALKEAPEIRECK